MSVVAVTEAGFRVLDVRCPIKGHGRLIRRSDAMGDVFCPDCAARHLRAYSQNLNARRALVAAEARRRGATCEFTLDFPSTTVRCLSRFEDGGLQWHHTNPSDKVAAISSLIAGGTLRALEGELAKCRLLCRHHHKIVQRTTR